VKGAFVFLHPLIIIQLVYSFVNDVIQATLKDPLEALVGLVTRLSAKRFKETFNELLRDT